MPFRFFGPTVSTNRKRNTPDGLDFGKVRGSFGFGQGPARFPLVFPPMAGGAPFEIIRWNWKNDISSFGKVMTAGGP